MPLSISRVIWTAALAAGTLQTARTQDLTEKRVIESLLADSPQIRALRAGVDAVRAEMRGRTLYPNGSASYAREGAGLAEFFEYEQPLIITTRRRFLTRAAVAAETAAQHEVERSIWNLRADLRLAFWHLLEGQERHKIIDNTIRELEDVVRVLGRRQTEGEGSRFDVLRAQGELLEAETDRDATEAALARSRGLLLTVIGGSDGVALRAAGSFGAVRPAPQLETLVSRALEVRPDYLALRAQLERYRNEKLAADRLRVPDPIVTVGVKRGEGFPGDRLGSAVAIKVPLPLFNRGQAERARSEAEYEQTQGQLETLARRIRAEITAALSGYELRRTLFERYRTESQQRGSVLMRIAKSAYEEGEKSILDLLDVYRLARHAELRGLELLAATKDAEIELERSVGEEVFP
jgi:cobalt-zinc-cadmium efflux system outer membrane protein